MDGKLYDKKFIFKATTNETEVEKYLFYLLMSIVR
jgi:hypothetical protein